MSYTKNNSLKPSDSGIRDISLLYTAKMGVFRIVINTINSVDRYTTEKYIKDVKEDGYVKCYLPKLKYGSRNNEAELLVKSMVSGLEDIQNSYGEEFVRVVYEKD